MKSFGHTVCRVLILFGVFRGSPCSGSYVPSALYLLLCGSGFSLLRGSIMYVMSLSIHDVISLVRTYRRCILDNWST